MSIEDPTAARQVGPDASFDAEHTSAPWQRVLVPLDGAPLAEGVLPAASRIARALGLEIVLMRAVRDVAPRVIDGTRNIVIDNTAEQTREAEEYLHGIAARLSAAGFRVQTLVRRGDAAVAIIEAGRECRADLIAMAARSRSSLGRLFHGSVADAVVHRAQVPVFVVRAVEAKGLRQAA
jgi:universal stress protein A